MVLSPPGTMLAHPSPSNSSTTGNFNYELLLLSDFFHFVILCCEFDFDLVKILLEAVTIFSETFSNIFHLGPYNLQHS